MIKAADMCNTIPDEKVVLTYTSYLCARLLDLRQETRAARTIQLAWRKYFLSKSKEKLKVCWQLFTLSVIMVIEWHLIRHLLFCRSIGEKRKGGMRGKVKDQYHFRAIIHCIIWLNLSYRSKKKQQWKFRHFSENVYKENMLKKENRLLLSFRNMQEDFLLGNKP